MLPFISTELGTEVKPSLSMGNSFAVCAWVVTQTKGPTSESYCLRVQCIQHNLASYLEETGYVTVKQNLYQSQSLLQTLHELKTL